MPQQILNVLMSQKSQSLLWITSNRRVFVKPFVTRGRPATFTSPLREVYTVYKGYINVSHFGHNLSKYLNHSIEQPHQDNINIHLLLKDLTLVRATNKNRPPNTGKYNLTRHCFYRDIMMIYMLASAPEVTTKSLPIKCISSSQWRRLQDT